MTEEGSKKMKTLPGGVEAEKILSSNGCLLQLQRLVAAACDALGIPFAKNSHPDEDYLTSLVGLFTHSKGVRDIDSFVTRGLEEERIQQRCNNVGVVYLPPKQRESTKKTKKRRGLLIGQCKDAEGRIQRKPPPGTNGTGSNCCERLKSLPSFLFEGTLRSEIDGRNGGIDRIDGKWERLLGPTRSKGGTFELIRHSPPDEKIKGSPRDGEYVGAMMCSNRYASKKEVINPLLQLGMKVKLIFAGIVDEAGKFDIMGTSLNELGAFELVGEAQKLEACLTQTHETYRVLLWKTYLSPSAPIGESDGGHKSPPEELTNKKSKKGKAGTEQSSPRKASICPATFASVGDGLPSGVSPKFQAKPSAMDMTRATSGHSPQYKKGSKVQSASFSRHSIAFDAKLVASLQHEEIRLGKERGDMLSTSDGGQAKMHSSDGKRKSPPEELTGNRSKKGKARTEQSSPRKASICPATFASAGTGSPSGVSSKFQAKPSSMTMSRAASGHSPQYEEGGEVQSASFSRHSIAFDAKLAASLQHDEIRLAKERGDMLSTPQGLSYKFVESVLNELKNLRPNDNTDIGPVAVDDMVHQAEGMLKCKETFKSIGKDCTVDIGYHFTKRSAMNHIQHYGLMTMNDRDANPKLSSQQSKSRHANGGVFGDGVYTGNNPFAFKRYGDVGLVVARLKGKTRRIGPEEVQVVGTLKKLRYITKGPLGREAMAGGFDTVVGNKTPKSDPYMDEVVLLRSAQCIPLIRFPVSVVSSFGCGAIPFTLRPYIRAMEKVVGDFFNNDVPNQPTSKIPSKSKLFQDIAGNVESGEPNPMQSQANPPTAVPSGMAGIKSDPKAAKSKEFGSRGDAATRQLKRIAVMVETTVPQSSMSQTGQKPVSFSGLSKRPRGPKQNNNATVVPKLLTNGMAPAPAHTKAAKNNALTPQKSQPTGSSECIKATKQNIIATVGPGLLKIGMAPAPAHTKATKSSVVTPHKSSPATYSKCLRGPKQNNNVTMGPGLPVNGIAVVPAHAKATKSSVVTPQKSSLAGCSERLRDPEQNSNATVGPGLLANGMAVAPAHTKATKSSAITSQKSSLASDENEIVAYVAPDTLSHTCLVEELNSSDSLASNNETCTVCLEKLDKSSELLMVKKCQHIFCRDCILQSLQHSRRCPSCHDLIGEPQGKSPSGKMIITLNEGSCAGYENAKTILIKYELRGGKQREYHEERGKKFKGTQRVAFLPDNDDGRRLLVRLKYAFCHGLTFSVGTSITSGKSGVITWASIHHKTAPYNGKHGWPDESYFVRCNKELDRLGVPKASESKVA